jgi:DNA-binding SARP family transcriptional activator
MSESERSASTEHTRTPSLEEATAEYKKLAASFAALSSRMEALGMSVGLTAQSSQPPAPTHQSIQNVGMALAQAQLAPPTQNTAPVQPRSPGMQDTLVRVYMLGPFQIDFAGRRLGPEVPGQVRTVLEYIIAHRQRPIPKDALLDLLWPEADPSTACGRLRVLMHTLRRVVSGPEPPTAGGLVLTLGSNFMLNPAINIWVDVDEFEYHWQQGWRLMRAGLTNEAMREYEQAEALYAGDYLEDQPYADWTLLRREALKDAYASILTMLATISLQAEDYTGTIIWAQKLLGVDNCREDAYRLLMTSHTRLGQLNRALYWYELCVRTLQRELGLEPSAETQAIYQEMHLNREAPRTR